MDRSGEHHLWTGSKVDRRTVTAPRVAWEAYVIARGRQMSEHAVEAAFRRDGMLRGQTSAANDVDQLSRLASLREDGVIDEFEFLRMKARVIA